MLTLFGFYLESLGQISIFCNYTFDSHHEVLYTCVGIVTAPCGRNCSKVVDIRGKHEFGKSNENVKALVVENQEIAHFLDVSSFFPNIVYLNFANNSIANITWTDLENYPNLETLRLSGNIITSISEDIFKNLSLRHIEIENNQLDYVDHHITFPISLAYLNFKNNTCINMEARSPEAIDKLKDLLLLRCSLSPRTEKLEETVNNIEEHDKRITSLENLVIRLKNAMKIKLY